MVHSACFRNIALPHRVYGFSTMLVTCSHFKPSAVPSAVPFPVHNAGNARRRLATAVPRNRYPYPLHPRPTPYQIFHLVRGANQKQVKDRCEFYKRNRARFSGAYALKRCLSKDYELVRVHHPDSLHSRASDLPKRVRDERFSAIKDAYDILTGKKPGHASQWNSPNCGRDWELRSELERRRHRRTPWEPQAHAYSQSHYAHQYAPPSNGPMTPEDRRRDNILICVAFLVRAK